MKILKRIAIAFSMYSRIPMPIFEWEDDDYRKAIAFLPLVGLVIGLIEILVMVCGGFLEVSRIVMVPLLAVVPIIVTGGFHLDGYMDVNDALSSYQGPEKSLEIMKDPHIGAFAVVGLARYGLIYLAALLALPLYYMDDMDMWAIKFFAACFVIVRAMCGITSLVMKKAKKDGMLSNETKDSGKGTMAILYAFLVVGVVYTVVIRPVAGIVGIIALLAYTWYYGRLCEKRFGGVTGDTAGLYVCQGELVYLIAMAIYEYAYMLL
jgi:adenosylcobinamide-GDP ribazoletransferase